MYVQTDFGWKFKNPLNPHDNECKLLNGIHFVKCIDEHSYSTKEIFNARGYSFIQQPFFTNVYSGLNHPLYPERGMISNRRSTLAISFNPNLTFSVVVTDPKLEFTSTNPDTFPKSLVLLAKNSGSVNLYLKVNI